MRATRGSSSGEGSTVPALTTPSTIAAYSRPPTGPAHPQVGGLDHVEHPPTAAQEEVHARAPRQASGEAKLGHLRVRGQRRQRQEVVEAEDAQGPGPLEQSVEQVSRGEGVVESAMARAV